MSPARRRTGALLLCALTLGALSGCATSASAQTALLRPPAGSADQQAASGGAEAPVPPRAGALTLHTPPPAPVVVTIGDSIMAGYGLSSGQDWPTLLAQATGSEVTNLGCSGGGFIAVGSCGTDFAGLIPAAVQVDPSIVIVQGSDNDAGQSDAALDAATADTIAELHRQLPNALIVGLSSLWDPAGPATEEIQESSAAVQSAVIASGGIYVDIGQPMQADAALLQSDHEHPTAQGQVVLEQTVLTALTKAGISI